MRRILDLLVLLSAAGLGACADPSAEFGRVTHVCEPSDLAVMKIARLTCAASYPLTRLSGDRPCRAEWDTDLDGKVDVTEAIDARGNVGDAIRYTYTEDGQVARAVLAAESHGLVADATLTYAYVDGKVQRLEAGEVRIDFTFDGDRLLAETSGGDRLDYVYDARGYLSAQRLTPEGGLGASDLYRYTRDDDGRLLERQAISSGQVVEATTYAYDGDRLVSLTQSPSSAPSRKTARVRRYGYEGDRLAWSEVDEDGDGEVDRRATYVYCE